MAERHFHGVQFEDFILSQLGEDKRTYTDKWDAVIDNIPISIKCIGRKNAVEFGSLLRFYKAEPFTLIVGWWDTNKSKVTGINVLDFNEEVLLRLKGKHTLEEIEKISELLTIKNYPVGFHKEARLFFKNWKKINKKNDGLLTLTGKVDSKSQRRWQCSLNNTNYKKIFGNKSTDIEINLKEALNLKQ